MIAAFLLTMLLTMVFIRIATRGARRRSTGPAAYDSYPAGFQQQQEAFYAEQTAFYEEQAAFYEEQADYYRASAHTDPEDEYDTYDDSVGSGSVDDPAMEYATADDEYTATFDAEFLHELGIDPKSFR